MISVLISTFGDKAWQTKAKEAYGSVLAQTKRCEIVTYHHTDSLKEARNTAAAAASGDWLCFLDADDKLDERYIESMEEKIASIAVPALIQPATLFLKDGKVHKAAHLIPARDSILLSNWMVIGTLVPKEVFDAVGGFDDWPIYEDWELWIRCVKAGCSFETAENAIYIVNQRDQSRNNQTASIQREVYDKIRSHHMK